MCQPCQQLGPVLETGATDDSDRNMLRSEAPQCLHQFALTEALREFAAKRYLSLRRRHSVLIAEEVSDQRPISAAARRYRQRSPGNRGDQHRPLTH